MAGRTAFILKGYPRLSETFIAQEIRALERRGLAIDIWSLRHPTDQAVHPVHDEIEAPVAYLPEYLREEPERVRRAIAACRELPAYGQVLKLWERDFARDPTANRVRRLGQAFVMAAELPPDVAWLHAHFLHTPASVARYAALLRGLPWSVSAHAKDIWTSPEWEKREKLAACAWAVTCTGVNADHLAALAPEGRVELVYHGLDLNRFPPPSAPAKAAPPVILSVGRAVPKKGYGDLLEALARVRAPFRFVHIGGGGEIGKLQARAAELGLADRVEWRGPQPQSAVLAACREASLFALASRVTGDGDRDGLPNVIVEAQSQRLPVVATAVSAIPELILDGENGRLAAEGDVAGLAAAIEELLADPGQAERMGRRGEEIVRRDFDLDRCIGRLAQRFGLAAA
ncbi:glycosyltransferase [Minwuia thermotolerans]|uniref:Colanic acid biosynthesis glycosyltransferase WcaL n=1 Tax=Minwuia thermotolerans TaxID=2056226 RepID=A0A2M9G5R6_9PROT|nr:glycosyltransferase [Minwuia thermotolerans]PJK31058.1 colanic acid biosynthesis glycosyltransferase WcaL [Minwuia thermotolerans]